jgi:hypothetical protein
LSMRRGAIWEYRALLGGRSGIFGRGAAALSGRGWENPPGNPFDLTKHGRCREIRGSFWEEAWGCGPPGLWPAGNRAALRLP